MLEEYLSLQEKIHSEMDDKRFIHTLGVAYTASAMAMAYGEDFKRAYLAGLLHDCAKCHTNLEFITLCEEYGIPITESEYENPFLLHAKLGAYFARHKYNINDEEILSAITWHTTGKPDMTLLEKIIFISDYIEPDRRELPNISDIRKAAFTDTDMAMVLICGSTIRYLEDAGRLIDSITRDTYNFYLNLCKETGKV